MAATNRTVFQQLTDIAESRNADGYLTHYRDDLYTHDKNSLDRAIEGDRFIWILRGCGTELFPVAVGQESIWATYWLDQGNTREAPSLCYLVTVERSGGAMGTIKAIDYDRCRKLAAIPHPDGVKVKIQLFA